jgi:hypothetical protein
MFKSVLFAVGILIAFTAYIPVSAADEDVATVSRLKNSAVILRQSQQINLQVGDKLQKFDEIKSGTDARVEIVFKDGTKLNIGANCHIVIDEFLFDPDNNIGIAILRALQGPFRFITGHIGKIPEPQIVVQSRFGVIGVRGTDFWAGPSRGVYGVLLLDGSISVTNPMGQRILTTAGTGVNLSGNNVPPGEVTVWGVERAQEALAAVAF